MKINFRGKRLLFKSSFRYLLTHPLQIMLTISGIAMGVAVVIAIDLASSSAERAFTASAEIFSSKVTHKIENSSQNINENDYAKLRLRFPQLAMAPVLEKNIKIDKYPELNFRLFGIDPFSEASFRDFNTSNAGQNQLVSLLTQTGAVLISETTAKKIGANKNKTLQLSINGNQKKLFVVGLIKSDNKNLDAALDNLILTDISVAQEILDHPGYLSRIEISTTNETLLNKIIADLPKGSHLIPVKNTSHTLSQMTAAFRTNLQAMSLLALIVGMFLIYNTITFSLIQRRNQFATLRTIGVTHKEIFLVMFVETFLIGLIGTVLGLIIGALLGKGLLSLVVRTINDLYFDLNLSQLFISPLSLFKGLVLGLLVTLLSAWLPMREAFKTSPRENQNRSYLESKKHALTPKLALLGLFLLLFGLFFLFIGKNSLPTNFVLLFIVLCGYALLVPFLVTNIIRFTRPAVARYLGNIGAMSLGNISNSLSRTGIAMTALTLAVATTIGVTTMVSSFRSAVDDWLAQSLKEDIYISLNKNLSNESRKKTITKLTTLFNSDRDINNFSIRLWTRVNSEQGKKPALILDLPENGFQKFMLIGDKSLAKFATFQNQNTVLISEPLANKNRYSVGDNIKLYTDKTEVSFRIIGIYRDYTTDQGVISMSRKTYAQHWLNPAISSFGLYLNPGVFTDVYINRLRNQLNLENPDIMRALNVRSNESIRTQSLEIFDQTFAITHVLRLLTIIVAFIGILSAFMALQLARGREFATLRVIGLTPKQLWFCLLFETSFMGLMAGLLAIPLGLLLSIILILVINIQSFGWSMAISANSVDLLQAVMLSITAALLAGLYPAYKMSKAAPAQSLRND